MTLLLFSTTAIAAHDNPITLSFGGRLKVDAVYNANSVGGIRTSKSDLAFSPGSIPVTGSGRNAIDANLRDTRFWSTLSLPLAANTLSTYIEFDFFDTKKDAGGRTHVSNDPRLRHLYSTFKNLTVGKTYTTFVNLSSYPEINDANGPVGNLIIRQELIRYSTLFSWGELFLALEKGESSFTTATGNSIQVNDDQLPDIIGKIQFSKAWGNLSVAGLVREINANNRMMTGINDTEWGAAISIAGQRYLVGQDNLRFAFSYGNVLGKYTSFNAYNDASISTTGEINLTEIVSTHITYQHWWTPTIRSSFVLGAAYADHDTSIVPTTVNKTFISSHMNLLWSPITKISMGLEWLHGYREQENSKNGNMDRLQFSLLYKF